MIGEIIMKEVVFKNKNNHSVFTQFALFLIFGVLFFIPIISIFFDFDEKLGSIILPALIISVIISLIYRLINGYQVITYKDGKFKIRFGKTFNYNEIESIYVSHFPKEEVMIEFKDKKHTNLIFNEKTINFDKTMDLQIKNDIHAPKTSCSNREITMQPELEELCKEVKHDLNAKRLKYGTRTKIFFSDINGDYSSYYAFNKYLGKVSKDVLGRKITTHVLRHTHVSLLAEAGVPLETITRRVGHEDSRITKKIYLHVTERMKERDRQLINGVNLLA